MARKFHYLAFTFSLLATSYSAHSYTIPDCYLSIPDNSSQGDDYVSAQSCSDSDFQYQAESDFNLVGWNNDYCNNRSDGARVMNALWLLKNSDPGNGGNILNWAYDFSETRTDKLEPSCKTSYVGRFTMSKKLPSLDNYGRMYISHIGLFETDVVYRASLLVHEARHYDKPHNKGCNANFLEDLTDTEDCSHDSSWSYQGSYMYQVLWLWWFAELDLGFPKDFRTRAANHANWIINNRFDTKPNIVVEANLNNVPIVNDRGASGIEEPVRITKAPSLSMGPTNCGGYCSGQNLMNIGWTSWAGTDYYELEDVITGNVQVVEQSRITGPDSDYRVRACYERYQQCSPWSDGAESPYIDRSSDNEAPSAPEPPQSCTVQGPYGRINIC